MSDATRNELRSTWRRSAVRSGASFLLPFAGAVAGLVAARLLNGRPEEFLGGRPLVLSLGAALLAGATTAWLRRPWAAAAGVYAGLSAFAFLGYEVEYPESTCIALAVHGLLPAGAAALGVAAWRRFGPGRASTHSRAAR